MHDPIPHAHAHSHGRLASTNGQGKGLLTFCLLILFCFVAAFVYECLRAVALIVHAIV